MKGLCIKPVPRVDTNDKGPVISWMRDKPAVEIPVFYRKAGSVFGQHYHTGKDPSKKPEIFLLLKGTVEVTVDDGNNAETVRIEEMSEMEIDPMVWHQFRALTDVVFAEWRPKKFDKNNRDLIEATREEFRSKVSARR